MKKRNRSGGKTNLYQVVTNQIIDLLENHTLSWDKPWVTLSSDGKQAHNALSGHTYSGLNQILLSIRQIKAGYPYGGWLTFRQVNKAGGQVLAGEKASEIFFHQVMYYDKEGNRHESEKVEAMTKEDRKLHELKKRLILKRYKVFNVAQTSGLPDTLYEVDQLPILTEIEKDERVENLIHQTDAKIIHKPSNKASYNPRSDVISLPDRKQFKGKQAYYKTVLHELAHWTGHSSRLDRNLQSVFGSEDYAKEELVAELCSAFICAELGFSKTITNNAAYIQSWIGALKNDHRYIFKAVRDAEKAASFIQKKKEREQASKEFGGNKERADQQIQNIKDKRKDRDHGLDR